jgi:hypothetical protein
MVFMLIFVTFENDPNINLYFSNDIRPTQLKYIILILVLLSPRRIAVLTQDHGSRGKVFLHSDAMKKYREAQVKLREFFT